MRTAKRCTVHRFQRETQPMDPEKPAEQHMRIAKRCMMQRFQSGRRDLSNAIN